MLCTETHSESGENICSSYRLIFLQHVYLRHAVHMQNGPKMSIYQQIISNQQPVTYSLSQIQSRLACPFSPVLALPAAPAGLHSLALAWSGSNGIMPFWEGGNSRKLSPLHPPHHGRDIGNGGGDTCAGRRKEEHGSSSETLNWFYSTHPFGDPMPGTYPACSPHLAWQAALPRPGMSASMGWCITASLAVLRQNLERCKHRSASPCFQHSYEWRSFGYLFFFLVPNQRNLLQM